MGLFSAWNICCIFPMLILVDHKQVTPQPPFKQKNSTEFSVSYHKVFQISGFSHTFPWSLSNLSTSLLKCGLENGTECSPDYPVLWCTEINPGRGSSCACSGHSAQQHHRRRWHSSGCSLSPLHLSNSSGARDDLWPPSPVMKGQPWARGRKWLPWSLDHLA